MIRMKCKKKSRIWCLQILNISSIEKVYEIKFRNAKKWASFTACSDSEKTARNVAVLNISCFLRLLRESIIFCCFDYFHVISPDNNDLLLYMYYFI